MIDTTMLHIGLLTVLLLIVIAGLRHRKHKSSGVDKDILKLDFDKLEGHDFEQFCAYLLYANGYKEVKVTKGSGDHGIDVLATYKKKKYAIQCKRYSNTVGNRAVQEAYAGKGIYKTDYAVVMTNSYFTKQAMGEAEALGVLLWNRTKLLELIKQAK